MSAIAAIHVAKRDIGIEEGDYRSLLERVTGKNSLKLMSSAEHVRVLDELRAKGAPPAKGQLSGPYGGKLQALWLSAWNLGIVRDRADTALLSFVRGQTGIEHTRFLRDAKDARKAVEALKKWIQREGGVDWSAFPDPKDCVIAAQVAILGAGDAVGDMTGGRIWMAGQADDKAKIALMQRLGTRIRAKAGA